MNITGNIDYWTETDKLEELYHLTTSSHFIQGEYVDFWHHSFVNWVSKQVGGDRVSFTDELEFQELLREFLISTPEGHEYLQDITFNGTLIGDFHITVRLLFFIGIISRT
jgi:hypothetical protein